MRRCTSIAAVLAAFVLAALPLTAGAQSFRCVGKDGRKYYGQIVPRECIGRSYEELNQQGLVIRRVDPFVKKEEVSPAVKAAEEKKKREQELAHREEERRARALLATYTSTKDIEGARARALRPITQQINDLEADIARLQLRIEKLKKKKEGPQTQSAIESAQSQIDMQSSLLGYKKKEAEDINARYDDDKKRYIKLTGGR